MIPKYEQMIQSLVLVRLGQELGSDSDIAQAIAHAIDALLRIASSFFG